MRGLVGLALDGLRRKPSRNVLTLAGVAIGVWALTLIVALGQGLSGLVEGTVAGEDNLRQIGLSPGFGFRISDDEVRIEGVPEGARRDRLARAARVRTRPGTFVGRRAQALDASLLAAVRQVPHVERVEPIVLERYRLIAGEHVLEASATIGVDVGRRRYADRVVAGAYFSGPDAPQALVHEYLAYRWGYVDEADLPRLVGQTLRLVVLQNEDPTSVFGPGVAMRLLDQIGVADLTDEELDLLPGIVEKLLRSWWTGGRGAVQAGPGTLEREVRIVGVVRDLEGADAFRVIEDGNAIQADVFLPQAVATDLFLAQPVNRELGFSRAVVTVDEASNAGGVEQALRDRGFTAFSVAAVVDRVDDLLAGLTVAVSLLTGIALLVAALGIVNTMVTSVLERTREIGLWKAVGATRGQVRATFLLEAGAIGLLGGLLGLGLALVAMMPLEGVASRMIAERAAVPITGSVFRLPPWLPVAGPVLATVVAMLASLYPAHRAATIDPVRALHHE